MNKTVCCSRGSISTSRSSARASRDKKMFACLYQPTAPDRDVAALLAIAREFSPRYEQHRDDLVSIDVSGLDRLIGPPATIGEELRREAAARGVHVHVALASTRMAAVVLALARPGVTIVPRGDE